MDTNCRAMDRDCKEIDLIRGSFLPLKNIERERERERKAINWFILQWYLMLNYNHLFIKKTSSNLIDAHGLR